MNRDATEKIDQIKLLLTEPHECSYLSQQQAITGFVDPELTINNALYGRLTALGFRRSGPYLYSPFCSSCQACIPARIPVIDFQPNRSQKRCLKRNADLQVVEVDCIDFDEHYPLYEDYIINRHQDGDMYPPSKDQFKQFLGSNWDCSRFLELRADNKLLGCAVVDHLPHALSAIYTYFNPLESVRGLGTLAVLLQIDLAQSLNMDYLYLGYWIADCEKMRYKTNYRPIELLQEKTWRLHE
ncbi:MAG: arginyltransferase [Porticoccaceae bacterium]